MARMVLVALVAAWVGGCALAQQGGLNSEQYWKDYDRTHDVAGGEAGGAQ